MKSHLCRLVLPIALLCAVLASFGIVRHTVRKVWEEYQKEKQQYCNSSEGKKMLERLQTHNKKSLAGFQKR